MKEVDIQTKIKKSIVLDGGYSIKLSNAYSSGVPDLLCALPPYMPCLLEVKDLKQVWDNFDQTINVTALQSVTLDRVTKPYEKFAAHHYGLMPNEPLNWQASGILVALYHHREHRLVALPKDAERLDALYQADPRCWRKRVTREGVEGGYYEIAPLLDFIGIRRL